MTTLLMKVCTRCEEAKPRSAFHRRARARDGLTPWCKPCVKAYSAGWRTENADRSREQQRRYYEANRDEISAKRKERWANDPELRRTRAEANRTRYQADLETERAKRRAWRKANPEAYAAGVAAWQAANPEAVRAASRKYARLHPERYQLRRAVKAAARLGAINLDALWNDACALCGTALSRDIQWPHPESASVDHIVPISRGGAHAQDNLQWTHLFCNQSKGARLPEGLA